MTTRFRRFFCYLNLFVFMMLTLVTGDNVLLMFVGWEGVDSARTCSSASGEKDPPQCRKKAFIVNRIGDFWLPPRCVHLVGALGAAGV